MADFVSESDSEYTSYWRDWVSFKMEGIYYNMLFFSICTFLVFSN
jgi:hypothetical protein